MHYDTTLNGGFATAMALKADPTEQVTSVQEMHARIGNNRAITLRRALQMQRLFIQRICRLALKFPLSISGQTVTLCDWYMLGVLARNEGTTITMILIIYAHPYPRHSHANQRLLQAVRIS